MTKTATQRDVTKIIRLAEVVRMADNLHPMDYEHLGVIIDIAKAIDARTGRRDPSVRKKRSAGAGRKRVTR